MARIRKPDTVTWLVASHKPMKCLQRRFSDRCLPFGQGCTNRHEIRASGEERGSTILGLVREDNHIWRIEELVFNIDAARSYRSGLEAETLLTMRRWREATVLNEVIATVVGIILGISESVSPSNGEFWGLEQRFRNRFP
jgi:hypothetical protein